MDVCAGRRPPQGATRPDLHGEGTICIRAQTGAGEEESCKPTKSRKLDGRLRYGFDATATPEHSGRCRQIRVSRCVSYVCEQLCVPMPIDSIPSPPANAQVINDASNAAALSIMEAPPEIGNRSPGIWSVCFQGGTFDRVKQRCRPVASCHNFALRKNT